MDYINACFLDAVLKDRYMWFFDNRVQALCKMNMDNYEMELVALYGAKEKFHVRKIFLIQDKFFLTTGDSAKVLIFDQSIFSLREPFRRGSSETYMAVSWKNTIYFWPESLENEMICFDTSTQEYVHKSLQKVPVNEKIGVQKQRIGFSSLYEGAVWFVIQGTSWYGRYGLSEGAIQWFQSENQALLLSGICFDGEHIWLTQQNSGIITCVGKESMEVFDEQINAWIYNTSKYILIPPRYGNQVILIQKHNFKVSVVKLPAFAIHDTKTDRQDLDSNIINCCEAGDSIFLFQHGIRELLILHKDTLETKRLRLKCKNYKENCLKGEKVLLNEDSDVGLQDLILQSSHRIASMNKGKREVAESIWNELEAWN
ncbi:MAG: hypothetical protein HFJ10_12385 [Lachnospiraceae bacterium]|nr:hypothetical protein [Lachnospiraceae bacterium]